MGLILLILIKCNHKRGLRREPDVFYCWVKKGGKLKQDLYLAGVYFPTTNDQLAVSIEIFCTENNAGIYTDEPGVTAVRILRIELPGSGLKRAEEVKVRFGGTEIGVGARDKREEGQRVSTQVGKFVG